MNHIFYRSTKKLRACFTAVLTLFMLYGTVFVTQAQNCDSNSPYDQIQSSFHSTVVTRVDGTFLAWGERSAPSGTANNLSPLEITPANGYNYTGNLLDISLGSNSSNNAQFFLLTTDGLYGWGTTNVVVSTSLKNTAAFGLISMPVGITPANVRKMLATRDALLLLTHSGEVWISGRNAAIHGMGGVTPGAGDNYWGRVTTSAAGNPPLSGVADVRISPAGAFAYTSAGTYYTWGPNVFLGDGSAAASYSYATPMQLPFTGTPVMIAMTTGISGGTRQATYYSIDPLDGSVFAMGNNTNGQLGINNNLSQTGWVNVQNPTNSGNLLDVRFISGNDQDGWSTSTGAVTMITNGKHLYGLGSNQGTMIGGPVNNADYPLPIMPAGFVFGTDNPFYVETGGHTSVYVKECSDRYCYVGHRINGSMGDGTNLSQFESVFNCTYTAASVICGASTFDAGDAPLSYNNGFDANHYYLCMDSLYLGDIPPRANNGLPIPNVTAGADNNYAIGGDMQQGLEEDGVAFIPVYNGGTTYSLDAKVLNMMGSTANLYAWIDWNGNGLFEASEAATETFASMAGKQTKTLHWTGINENQVRCGRNYIRLRLTVDALSDNPATTNVDERSYITAYNGEIEDYNLIANLTVAAGPDVYTSIHTPLPSGSVTMAGTGAGVWRALPGNPGTALIADSTLFNTTISGFTAPGPYVFIYTSGYPPLACADSVTIYFNVKPQAQNDAVTVDEDDSITLNPLLNDSDTENALDSTSVSIIGGPSNGTAMVNPISGEITYTPAPGYSGPDSVIYVVCDLTTAPLQTLCDTAVIYITVNEINHPPVAVNDFATTPEEVPVTVNVASNDTDPDGNLVPGSVTIQNGPSNGTAGTDGSGNITYTPDPDFYGNDTITYVICDNGIPAPAYCDTAQLIITVTPVNDPPVANNDTATTPEDTPVVIPVIANDTDIDGNIVPNSVAIVTPPSNGSVSINALTGEITYTPDADFNGTDTFIYLVCDDGTPLPSLCDTAVVTVTITPVNDPPVANNDNATTPEDTPVVINIPNNDTDVDGNLDLTSVTITNGPSNGTVTIDPVTGVVTYTPNANYHGTDQFTYSICDTGMPVLCDTAVVTIIVTPVNDPPVIDMPDVSTPEDVPVTICSPVVDADAGDTFTASFCGGPYNGTSTAPVVFNGQVCITYTPVANYNGMDSVCIVVCDQDGACDTSVSVITITPVNDPPVANNDNATTPEDTPVVINIPNNDTDVDGNLDLTSVTITNGPSNGTVTIDPVTGVVTYTPNANYHGTDQFTYSICDTGMPVLCDTAVVTIIVTPVNDPPVIDMPDVSTPEDVPVTICSPVVDADAGDTFTASFCGGPYNGTSTAPVVFNGQVCITYTPVANYNGMDSVCIVVCDQDGACDTSVSVITITPVNDPPVANNDNATTPEDTPVVINIPNNDTDVDGNLDLTSVTITNGPSNGTVTIDPVTGVVTYTPNANYHGTDQFTYSICDTGMPVLCDTAVVTIIVTPVNDPPVIDMPDVSTPEDVPVTICSPVVDADAGDTFTASFCGGPYNGTSTAPVVFNGQVCITYTPVANYNGMDSVCIVVCDQDGACDTSVSVITITPVNDPPVANNDNATTPEDTPVVINIPNNDTDVDGNLDLTSVTITNGPSNGTVTIDPVTGVVTYTPNANYHGTDQFTYSICDTGMPVLCDTAVVTIIVTPVNDPPVIDMPDVSTPEDVPVTICSPVVDADAGDTFTASFCGGPYNGTSTAPVVFNGQVCITYTPVANYNGMDSVCIVVCDQDGACDTSVSVITITPVNDPPVANNDNATTSEDTPVVINIPNNDTDVDGNLDLTSVTITNGPSNGTVTIDPVTGVVTYTPNANYHGTDQFTYSICDTGMPVLCDTAVVTIIVTPVNDPPVIDMPDVSTPEDVPVTICSPVVDADAGDTFTASFCGGPYNGTSTAPVVFNGQVCITYTPVANYNGMDSVCIVVCDQDGACDTSVSVITITPVNDPPVANNDNATTGSSTPVTINVISNDTDIDGNIDPTTVTITNGPVNGGSVSIDPVTGAITYTPGPNTCGTDHFTYQVCDDGTPLPALCDTAVVSITITDTEAPVISCPASLPAFTAFADICGYQISGTALDATATDNCGAVTLTHNYYSWANPNSLNGATFPLGTTVVTWTATDAAGNTSSCNVNVTVEDHTAPSFLNCASGAVYTVSLFPDDCEGGVIWPIPVAMDNCGTVTVTQTSGPAHGSLLTVGSYVIAYTATDGNGNSDICSFTINVIDTEDPTITCPGNIISATTDPGTCGWTSPAGSLTPLLVTSNCAATVGWSVQNPNGSLNTGSSDISGYTFATGQSVVTYTVTETASGQNWSCSFTVNVADNEAPAISGCLADTTISSDAGICGASFSWTAPTASDNCTLSSFTSTHTPGAVFPVGTTTVTYTAVDSSGNITTCSFTVTVNDTEAPVIADCPADIVVSNDSSLCSAVVNWTAPTATDNCGAVLSVTSSHQPGDVFPTGTTTVTYTFTDAAGNQQVCRFNVTVNDTEAPVSLNCPSDINSCNEFISWTPPSFSDNCSSILNISSNYTPGSLFPVGSTLVVYTATDAAGNSSSCSFYVRRSAMVLTAAGTDVQCAGAADGIAAVIVESGIAPYTFSWNNGSSSDSSWTGLAPGTYTVTVSDAIGCTATATLQIAEPAPLRVVISGMSKATCGLEDGTIYSETYGGTGPYSYLWSNGYAGPVLVAEAGSYTLTLTDANGCTDTASATLECDFKVPQLVSPNGDGHNDTWTIPGIELYPEAVVELYNRWGNLVYKASPYLNDFAGYSNGLATVGNQKLPAGTYFYVIILKKGEKAYQGYIELTY